MRMLGISEKVDKYFHKQWMNQLEDNLLKDKQL